MEPRGAADRVGMPGIVLADRQQRRRVGRRRDPHAGAEVAHVARLLEQDDRRLTPVGQRRTEVGRLAPRDRDDPGRRRLRHQPGELLRVDLLTRPSNRPARSGARSAASPSSSPGSIATASSTSAPNRSACFNA